MNVTLERLEFGDEGVFGRVVVGDISLFTGELPWRGNVPDFSCIPLGLYHCKMTYSPHFQRMTYQVMPVDNRSQIRIHPANLMGDKSKGLPCQLNGCIALGEKLGTMDGQKALLVSSPAVRRFEKELGREPFILEIKNG